MSAATGRTSYPVQSSRLACSVGRALAPLWLLAGAACSDAPLAGPDHPVPTRAPTLSRVDAGAPRTIADEYIVLFAKGTADAPGLARRLVAEQGGELRFTYTSAVQGFAATLPAKAVDALRRNPNVALVEADQAIAMEEVQQPVPSWGLDRIDQRAGALDGRYSYSNAGSGVNVYVFDTGIRTSHREFEDRASGAFTVVSDGRGTDDCRGHGTHVAGVIGGRTYGVAKAARLFAVRVLGCDGTGSGSGLLAALDWVTRNRALPAVANMSLGSATSSALQQAVEGAIASGIVVTVAAGNSSIDACTVAPANVGAAITVGASNEYGWAESYSNYGRCVDLYAPGRSVLSSWYTSDSSYAGLSGTSAAAPHVAGAAALVLSAHPSATPAEVHAALIANATPNALSSVGQGTPNLLLYTAFVGGSGSDPASVPPSPSPQPAELPATSEVLDAPPTASFTASCPKGRCTFDGSSSADDRGIVSYRWDFGDGSVTVASADRSVVSHTYAVPGTFAVRLTVIDGSGQERTASRSVSIKRVF